jgi:glycosyltransferase involved in cell wall biosynthesis
MAPDPRDSQETLYVLVPCFNEEAGIEPTVEGILRHAATLPLRTQILLIDDGSKDATRSRMQELCARHAECTLLANERNLGMGRCVLQAYERIPAGSWVTVLPGDNELDFASIDNFLAIRRDYDVILGYLQNPVVRTLARRLASFAYGKVVNTLYGFPWRYLNGLKLYRIEAFRGLGVVSGGHAFIAELLAKAQLRTPHLRIGEAPFVARGRARGSSKAIRPASVLQAVRDVMRSSRSVARYRRGIVRGEAGND